MNKYRNRLNVATLSIGMNCVINRIAEHFGLPSPSGKGPNERLANLLTSLENRP